MRGFQVLGYAIRRVLGAVPTLLVIVTISFFMIRRAPGGPFDRERPVPAEIAATLDRVYHLDEGPGVLTNRCRLV